MAPPVTVHLVTYATHAAGTFARLRERHPEMVVLGWGTPWKGFFDKVDAVQRAVTALPPEDVVVFVDGFDTQVIDVEDVRRAFEEDPYLRLVFARHVPPIHVPYLTDYVVRRQFCGVINSGTYAGRVRDLQVLYREAQNVKDACFGDDQRAFNVVAAAHPEWTVDAERRLFHVLAAFESAAAVRARVTHRPGTSIGWWRVCTGVVQAAPAFRRELYALVALLFVAWVVMGSE